MPVLTPAELWEATGRIAIPEVFHLEDRTGRRFILPFTHEETVTFHAREIQSYRQLPQMLYHFSIKNRDEPRPRGGLLRVREFIMKDAYSFDRDEAGLDVSFRKQEEAYHRIFQRCGLEYSAVAAESGSHGRQGVHRLPRAVGLGREHARHVRERRLRGGSRDRARHPAARGLAGAPRGAREGRDARRHDDRGAGGVPRHRQLGDLEGDAVVKADGTLVLGLVRGDDRLSESKMLGVLGSDFRPATDEEIRAAFGAGGGSLGPIGVDVEVVADDALARGQFVAGANRDGWHLLGVEAGRDFEPRFADIREPVEGDTCPECGGALRFQTAIEVGHIFKFGDPLLRAARGDVPRRGRDGEAADRRQLRHRAGRVMAAVVEQSHDENGIVWPASIAPYDVHVLALHGGAEEVAGAGRVRGRDARRGRLQVLLDDRDERPGEKFADADLIGCPVRVIVGKKSLDDGSVDVRRRDGSAEERVPAPDVLKWVTQA